MNAHFVDIQEHLSLTSNKEIEGGRSLVESHYLIKNINKVCDKTSLH